MEESILRKHHGRLNNLPKEVSDIFTVKIPVNFTKKRVNLPSPRTRGGRSPSSSQYPDLRMLGFFMVAFQPNSITTISDFECPESLVFLKKIPPNKQ